MKLKKSGDRSGSLHQFIRRKTNKLGIEIEYPLISGTRNEKINRHWNWNYTYKVILEDGSLQSKCLNVPVEKVDRVKRAIIARKQVEEILKILS